MTSKSQTKRGLIRRLIDTLFDENLSILDVPQRIADEIHEDSDAKAMDACIRKMKLLAETGWHRSGNHYLNLSLSWRDLSVQIEPNAVLKNENRVCLLYAYFRRSPSISTDGVRALLSLIKNHLRENGVENVRIVVLDCYNDRSYEDADFDSDERWVANRLEDVLDRYSTAYRIRLDGSPPEGPPPSSAPIAFDRATGTVHFSEDGGGSNQLSFQLV